MENRSLSVVAFLIALIVSTGLARADTQPTPEQLADWNQRLDQSAQAIRQARVLQEAAEQVYEEKDRACYARFRVNACRNEAKAEYVEKNNEARRIENEGKAIERQVKKEQLLDKDARYEADAPVRQADLQAREAETAAARQQAEREEAGKLADKRRKAEEGRLRREAQAANLQKKQAEHEARVAAKMEKAERRRQDDAAAKK